MDFVSHPIVVVVPTPSPLHAESLNLTITFQLPQRSQPLDIGVTKPTQDHGTLAPPQVRIPSCML